MHRVSSLLARPRMLRRAPSLVAHTRGCSGLAYSAKKADAKRVASLLRHIGNPKEVEQYLKTYTSMDPKHFALIKVGGNILDEDLDTLAGALAFLSSSLNLYPVVLHGGGPQISRALEQAGVKSEHIKGLRVTSPEVLAVARKTLNSENFKLVSALEQRGAAARPIQTGVFEADYVDKDGLGLVGKVDHVSLDAIHHSLESGRIPVISCLGETTCGQILNISGDAAGTALAKAMRPAKVVYMTSQGGLINGEGELVRTVELAKDFDALQQEPWMSDSDKNKLREINELLSELPAASTATIVDAFSLPLELFSHKGAGTLVRACAEKINTYQDFSAIDVQRMYSLFLHSYGAKEGQRVKVRNEYVEYVAPSLEKVYVTENYQAVAVVTKGLNGVAYLDKFAVDNIDKNSALAEELWKQVKSDYPSLFWRSKQHFAGHQWYFSISDGSMARDEWTVFWSGVEDLKLAEQLVREATTKPLSVAASTSKPAAKSGARGYHTAAGPSSFASSSAFAPVNRLFQPATRGLPARRFFSSAPSAPTKVGLVGARGHTGSELLRLMAAHPSVEVTVASSRAFKGRKLSDVASLGAGCSWSGLEFSEVQPAEMGDKDVDVWVLALPNNLAKPYVDALDAAGSSAKIVDLSADYRFDPTWTYGLPERHGARDKIKAATRVANPGCYATGMQCSLFPVMPDSEVCVFGISGYSGAGTTPSRKNDLKELSDNLMPYTLQGHLHEKEVASQLQNPGLRFMPHVAPWFRGISLTVALQLNPEHHGLSNAQLADKFREYYQNEPLIKVSEEIPEVKANQNEHFVAIGGFNVRPDGRAVITTTLDNLLKGAATQCLQNINLMMGHDELAGISK